MNKSIHHPLIVIFHWLSFALIMMALVLIEVKNYVPRENPWRADLKTYHMLVGQLIFLLVLLRVVAKCFTPHPQDKDPILQKLLKHIIHFCLYDYRSIANAISWKTDSVFQ